MAISEETLEDAKRALEALKVEGTNLLEETWREVAGLVQELDAAIASEDETEVRKAAGHLEVFVVRAGVKDAGEVDPPPNLERELTNVLIRIEENKRALRSPGQTESAIGVIETDDDGRQS